MPLFESQKARNDRLFKEILVLYARVLPSFVEDEHERAVHVAWSLGGCAAANIAVDGCKSLKEAWGKGDEQKALELTETFMLPMVSKWYRNVDEQEEHSDGERREARRVAASNVLLVLGRYREEAVEEFLKMDAQFNYDEDQRDDEDATGMPLMFSGLLWLKADGVCSGSNVDLSSARLPVESSAELRGQGIHTEGHFADVIQIGVALGIGAVGMFQRYENWSKGI